MNEVVIERETTVVFCSHMKDWAWWPRVERDHDGWPKSTVFRWLLLWVQFKRTPA